MQTIIDTFENLHKNNADNKPSWLVDFQNDRFAHFKTLGIPTVKHEEWKYSNLKEWSQVEYKSLSSTTDEVPSELKEYINADETNVVFVNGVLNTSLSNFDQEKTIEIKPLTQAWTENESEIKDLLTRYDGSEETTFMALNNALTNNGTFIKVKKGTVSEKLIHIVHVTTHLQEALVNTTRTIITTEKSCEAAVLESHVSYDDSLKFFTNTLTDVFVNENSTLHYVKAQKESEKAYHISNTRAWIEANANFKGFTLTTGTGFTRNNLDIVINGEGSDGTINSLYSMYGEQHVDNHTSVDHRVPNCTSNQLYKGILNNASHAVFNGKVFVRQIAQQTNSYQLNKNLLLGKNAHVDTKPQLEIFADDVKCTHGATIGQLDEDELFYLQTRCISRKEAIKIIANGFAEETIETIKPKAVHAKLIQLLQTSIDNLS
ncbi:MAG: Fe-S cluster assembly protein SufD [Candidatus Omnitrophota bacterium]|jgi:Fe-S cluster assembly protein SufD